MSDYTNPDWLCIHKVINYRCKQCWPSQPVAARPQEQDCAKPYAEIEGEWQASQPPEAPVAPGSCEWCDGLAIACANCIKRWEEMDFQRGAQAMAEKAAQALQSIAYSNQLDSARAVWDRCYAAIHYLTAAVEPPQEKEQP